MDDFTRYLGAINCGLYGIYFRSFDKVVRDTNAAAKMLRHATGLFSYLNIAYHTDQFPKDEQAIYEYLQTPFCDCVDELPDALRKSAYKERLQQFEEELIDYDGQLTTTGDEFLISFRSNKVNQSFNVMEEYHGQILFANMTKYGQQGYSEIRRFLGDYQNGCFPTEKLWISREQRDFCNRYPDIISLAYVERILPERIFYRCPHCNAPMLSGQKRCYGSVRCSQKLSGIIPKKEDRFQFLAGRRFYVLKPAAIRNIYTPAQLENEIEESLNKHTDLIAGWERWTNMDTWDFEVTLKNGKILHLDAKNIQNVQYLINDVKTHKDKRDFRGTVVYVLPKYTSKKDMTALYKQIRYKNFKFIKLDGLERLLLEEAQNA